MTVEPLAQAPFTGGAETPYNKEVNKGDQMTSQQHLDSLVKGLANDGHQEIVVVTLPSQAKRKHKSLFSPKNRKAPRAKVSA